MRRRVYPEPWQRVPGPPLAQRLGEAMREHPEWGFDDLRRALGGPAADELGDLLVRLLHECRVRLPPEGPDVAR